MEWKRKKKNTNSNKVQHTYTNNYENNYDTYIHYQQTNTSLQTTNHILDILQKDNTHSKHKREQDHTRWNKKHNKTKH